MGIFPVGLEHERGDSMICNECETVAHCTKHGCIPKQPAPVQDSTCNNSLREQGKAYPRTCKKCKFGPCIQLANLALEKMAENARELGLDYEPVPENFMDALKFDVAMRDAAPVQEPVAHCEAGPGHCQQCYLEDRSLALAAAVRYVQNNTPKLVSDEICMAITTPPAQPETDSCGSGAGCLYKVAMIENLESEVERLKAAQPAVPDAITDRSEHPEYIQGWNDCRAEMLKGMKS
jgi:hypothetical protein